MRRKGTLRTWNDVRGFGFIAPAQGGRDIFVHISAFPPGANRPAAGQALTYEVETGPNGKRCAHAVQYPVHRHALKTSRLTSPAAWALPRLLVIPAFGALWLYVANRWSVNPMLPIVYIGLSLLTFLAYAGDKSAAVHGGWRMPERTLHLLGLAGGWPGALLAQQLLLHKCSKPSFLAMFWLTVAVNIACFWAWHAGVIRNVMS